MAPSAVVIGLGSVTGLQTARFLARRGVRVIGIAGDRRHFAARTRECERIIEADVHGTEFIDALERLAPDLDQGAVLFPCTDQSVLLVSEHRERLTPSYSVVMPPHETVQGLADKATFHDHAVRSGLTVPQTFVLRGVQDARRAAAGLTFPAVVKPSFKCTRWKKNTRVKVRMVDSADELLSAYDDLAPWTDVLVAQEFVAGDDSELFTCNCYFDESGEPLVTFVTRKLRQWPPHVGTASLGEEVRNDEVVAHTKRLFRAARFRGLGYLEFKRHPDTGALVVIEANVGRPTGRSATAEAGDVELLYTMYCDASGLPLPAWREQRYVATKWIDVRRDLISAIYYHRRGELSLREWVASVRGPKAHAVFSWSDPRPFAYEIRQSLGKYVRRSAGVARRRTSTHHVARTGTSSAPSTAIAVMVAISPKTRTIRKIRDSITNSGRLRLAAVITKAKIGPRATPASRNAHPNGTRDSVGRYSGTPNTAAAAIAEGSPGPASSVIRCSGTAPAITTPTAQVRTSGTNS